jgi:uncharacterized protein
MTVELRPLGVACNLRCQYCYQNPQRDAGNVPHDYDMERMRAAVEAEGGPFTLFGGEPLLIPLADLEELWSWGLAEFGSNSLQTNGAAIKEEHYPLFKKYKVHVGISIDGPGELNDARWAGTVENTRAATARTERAIERLCREGIASSLIITLHRGNATADKLAVLHDWVRYLDGIGIRSARLHILESESEAIRAKYGLTTEENVAAFISFAELEPTLRHLTFDVFADMRRMLVGEDNNTTCIWNACDPYTTRAVRGVEGHGQRSNCGRTNKDGIDFVKSDVEGFERYIALYRTPQEAGGCRDCRFFLMCKGQCPGTAIDGDWRNRTEHCEVWKTLYTRLEGELEADGVEPLSKSPLRRQLELGFLDAWAEGENGSMARLLASHPERRQVRGAWRAELDRLRVESKRRQGGGSGS